ncbi:MFS transporter [Neoaquamicrobium microcysteis]|uniref:MFS transporter n=1 Tax=Neoaquamicrobium microcysteis TaxID=2682781 RepID=UPI001F3DFEE8|nr:MFS transporter [Mesorhizobium microcysteis]
MIERLPTLAPFRHRTFRSVWIASLVTNFGSLIQTVGAAWMMTLISTSADLVALVQSSTALPIMLFSLISGAIADNFNRRRVMLVAQSFMLVVSVALALTAWTGLMTPWLLLTFTFLIGCGAALNNPSWQASVGDMVPRADLPAAVALNSMGFNLTRSVGPAIGGAIVAAFGAVAAFAINAVSYLTLIFVLLRWKPPASTSTLPPEPLGLAIISGLRYMAMSPNIEKVLLRGFVFGFAVISVVALLPLVTRDLLGGGALLYGVLFGAFGAGAVGGAFVSGTLRQRLSTEWIARLSFTSFALSALIIALSPWPWLTFTALMVGGACWVIALSMFNITVQMSTPRWVVGRALSLYQMATFGGMALGSWIWGLAAEAYGPDTALQLAALVMIGGALLGLGRFALPALASLNLDPLNRWREPHLELDITPRSGPVKIMIEYEIDEKDTREFLEMMAERRRIRKRDGARRWSLTRDLEHPRHWIEAYHLPTWMEYVRYNLRLTHADAIVGEQIRKLHAGENPPIVRRMIERPTGRHPLDGQPKGMADLHQQS